MFASARIHDEINQFKPDQHTCVRGTYTFKVPIVAKFYSSNNAMSGNAATKVKFKVTDEMCARSGYSLRR
jgi:hypothetical protein